jgi:hypothetical protein
MMSSQDVGRKRDTVGGRTPWLHALQASVSRLSESNATRIPTLTWQGFLYKMSLIELLDICSYYNGGMILMR